MNPFLVKLGIGAVVLVVTCIAAYRTSRRQQALLQPTCSSFGGSGITFRCICLGELAGASESGLVRLPCNHKFHTRCIKVLFSQQAQVRNCPLCRNIVDSTFVETVLRRSD